MIFNNSLLNRLQNYYIFCNYANVKRFFKEIFLKLYNSFAKFNILLYLCSPK